MKLYLTFVMAISCGNFTQGVSLWFDADEEFYDYIYSIIMDHFPKECVCFFKDSKYDSSLFDKLVEDFGQVKLVSLVSPTKDEIPIDIHKIEPRKPYPCSYIVHLPNVGSAMPWLLLRGYYFPSGSLNVSRYLIVAEEFHNEEEIEQVLMEMFSYGFLDVVFLNFGNAQFGAYTLFPFGRDFKSCPEESPVTERIAAWSDGQLKQFLPLFPAKLPPGVFNGCSWNISCAYFNPYLLTDNGGHFTGPLEGYDAGPLSLMTERLNLTPQWTVDAKNLWVNVTHNDSVGSVPDLVLGRGAQMSCGGLGLYWDPGSTDCTMFYSWTSIQWFVAAPNKVPKWQMLVFAMNKSIWPFVLACASIVPTIYWVFCIVCNEPQSFSRILLSFTALTFGNITSPPPVISTLRLVFLAWLIYVMHIDQFYLASLTGLITSAGYEQKIKTAGDIIDNNLPTVGYFYTKIFLAPSPDESVQKLLENYVETNRLVNLTLLDLSKFKNFTVADNQVFIKHSLSTLSNVSIYPTSVIHNQFTIGSLMWRHNYLFKKINSLFLRMFDTGFPVYFLKKFLPPNPFWSDPMDKNARALTLVDLSGPFYMLAIGLSLSCLVFILEVLVFKVLLIETRTKPIGAYRFLR